MVFPTHLGASGEFERYKAAADEVGWLVIYANDGLGNEPEFRKRGADFLGQDQPPPAARGQKALLPRGGRAHTFWRSKPAS